MCGGCGGVGGSEVGSGGGGGVVGVVWTTPVVNDNFDVNNEIAVIGGT